MKEYKIKCECGFESTSQNRRETEAKQWHHAIHHHNDMLKEMSVEQFTGIMKGWDKEMGK
ncbi:MAG TPA: hypothetical protein VFF13_05110 [archaeon]|nr:hypothetical protein [archaeon]